MADTPLVNRTIPVLPVDDVESAVAWYERALGLEAIHVNRDLEGEDPTNYAVLRAGPVQLHLVLAEEAGRGSGAGLCVIDVTDVDQTFERLRALQVPIQQPPTDQPWGDRDFIASDPFGSQLVIAERGAAKRVS